MPLAAGTILGQYEIHSPLGAGGMGEVYRAHDTRLDRQVAIKVLPESVTADPERLRRFFLHVLPKGFVRIRHYGLLSNRFRKLLPLARTLLAVDGREPLPVPPLPNGQLWHCPRCGSSLRVTQRFTAAELYLAAFDSS